MPRTRTPVEPPGWARPRGYSNGIAAEGRFLFVAGQVGWDARSDTPRFPETFAEQFDLALANVLEVVAAAGGTPADLVRLTVYLTDKREYVAALRDVGASWRARVGREFPAMALVQVAGLLEDRAKVEIEATAVLG